MSFSVTFLRPVEARASLFSVTSVSSVVNAFGSTPPRFGISMVPSAFSADSAVKSISTTENEERFTSGVAYLSPLD